MNPRAIESPPVLASWVLLPCLDEATTEPENEALADVLNQAHDAIAACDDAAARGLLLGALELAREPAPAGRARRQRERWHYAAAIASRLMGAASSAPAAELVDAAAQAAEAFVRCLREPAKRNEGAR